ncbi:hypothetical protein Nepgr_021621 [Nepenthes gracilis]|uniref:Uncharacterized protein n=1 Tax=Nepenthes gracilis TaxID=150966 RepID=A0AAD3SZ30_NEPGR|nr:hypothetical protein Nepgr_021621 [Nepenthes gracilis]
MDVEKSSSHGETQSQGMERELIRRGPWTVEEDLTLCNYVAIHGEGRWNSLSRCAGLKRTGKSCRLRWLNYLRPDVRRGNITLQEQLVILQLHSRWGNRWSKIAQFLPGRTDNEIKNYWRTRVQKHAKQLKCDVNSKHFKDTMRYLWIPRLVERIHAANAAAASSAPLPLPSQAAAPMNNGAIVLPSLESSASSCSFATRVSDFNQKKDGDNNGFQADQVGYLDFLTSPCPYFNEPVDLHHHQWYTGGDSSGNLWDVEDIDGLQPQQ